MFFFFLFRQGWTCGSEEGDDAECWVWLGFGCEWDM